MIGAANGIVWAHLCSKNGGASTAVPRLPRCVIWSTTAGFDSSKKWPFDLSHAVLVPQSTCSSRGCVSPMHSAHTAPDPRVHGQAAPCPRQALHQHQLHPALVHSAAAAFAARFLRP